jgi:hypothetical protein
MEYDGPRTEEGGTYMGPWRTHRIMQERVATIL